MTLIKLIAGDKYRLSNLNNYHVSAQCFPRLACPLNRAVLMQVHEPAQAAPGLVREG